MEKRRTPFHINDKKTDLEDYEYLKSFLKWTPEERVLRFVPLVQKIGKLLCPPNLDIDLVKPGEIVVGNYNDIGSWRKEEILGKISNNRFAYKFHFAVEGLKKSTEFCFDLILHHMVIVMQYRVLRGRYTISPFLGNGAEWVK